MKGRECEMNHIKKKWNKILSAILSLAIVLSCVPVQPIFAADKITFTDESGNNIDSSLTMDMVGFQENVSKEVSIDATWLETIDEYNIRNIEWNVDSNQENSAGITVVADPENSKSVTITANKFGEANVTCEVEYDDNNNTDNVIYSGSIHVTVTHTAINPNLAITPVQTSDTVEYPDEVTFGVTSEDVDINKIKDSIKWSVDDEVVENSVGQTTITVPSLKPGTHSISVILDEVKDGNNTLVCNSKTVTIDDYVVKTGTQGLSITANPDTVNYPNSVTFTATPDRDLITTGQTISWMVDGYSVEGSDGKTAITVSLSAGKHDIEASVSKATDTENPGIILYSAATGKIEDYQVGQATASGEIVNTKSELYVGEEFTITLPTPTGMVDGEIKPISGSYTLKANDNLTVLSPEGASYAPGTVLTLKAGVAGAATKLQATFESADANYLGYDTTLITYTVKKIPVNVTWNSGEKIYDGTTEYSTTTANVSFASEVENFAGKPDSLPTVSPANSAPSFVFTLNGKDVVGSPWTGTLNGGKEALVLSDSDTFEIQEVDTVSVTVKPIELTIENIDLTGVVVDSKAYDATSVAKFVTEVPKFKNNNNILDAEFGQLKLQYEAHYYDKNDALVYGNPDENVYPEGEDKFKVKFSKFQIMQNDAVATNYVFAQGFAMPVFEGTFGIQANTGLNDFTGLGLQDPVLDTFTDIDNESIAIHWVNANGASVLQKTNYSFSEKAGTAESPAWNWGDTYTLTESLPKRVYAKLNSEGTISSGSYVALDTVAPTGNIFAKVGTGEAVSITELSGEFDTIAKGEGVEITFSGSDASSKIAKIECYGTDTAWTENTAAKWNGITPTYTYDVNTAEAKAQEVTQVLQSVEREKELKRFYYARVTDYAGNVSYISSSGVLLDVTVPTATTTLATATNTFDNKNVYDGDVNFTVALDDNNISSGIVNVEAVLYKNNVKIASYNTKEGDIWTASAGLDAINALLANNSPTDSQIGATKGITISGTLTGLEEANGYTLQIEAVDKVGNRSAVSEVNFIIDKAEPIITVTDNRTYIGNKAEHFTGGSMTVKIQDYTLTTSIADLVTELDDVETQWKKTVNEADGLITLEATFEFGDGKYYEKEGQYKFKVNTKDSMNREKAYSCEEFTLDYTAPTYKVEYSDVHADSFKTDTINGKDILYYNSNIVADFTIKEDTSYDDSKIKIVVKNKAGNEVMKWEDGAATVKDSNYVITHTDDTKVFQFKVTAVTAAEDDGYTFEISGTDYTGNVLIPVNDEAKKNLENVRVLDVTAPELTEVAYSTADVADAIEEELFKTITKKDENDADVVRDYINAPTTMTFTVTEHNPTTNQYTITKADENASAPTWQQKKDESDNVVTDVYTSAIKVPMNGDKGDEQVITYSVIDKAGNKFVKADDTTLRSDANTSLEEGIFTDKFTVDTVQPIIKYEYESYNPDRPGVDGIDYFKQDIKVKVTVDEHNFNGLDTKVVLFNDTEEETPENSTRETTTEGNGTSSAVETEWESTGDTHIKTFTLKGDDLYDITVSGNDCANNALVLTAVDKVTATQDEETKATKLSVAIDHKLPIINDSGKPVITVSSASSTTSSGTASGQPLFGGDVTLKVTVYDPNALKYSSGIDNVKFNVEAEDGTKSEATVEKAGTGASASGVNIQLVKGQAAMLGRGSGNVLEYNVTIASSVYNANNIKLKVTAEDIATNKSEAEADPFSIDTTPPEVRVTYDNNDVSNLKYFHDTRTATIQVTERNFSDDCMTFNVNGSPVPLSFTQTSAGSGNGDDAIWQATYPFENDDDYTVTGDVKDRIDNVGTVEFEGQAPEEFTVDKTLPTIEIEFDNNNAFNENYYDAERTATVIITETNFNPDEVEIIGDGNDAGTAVAYPTISGWSSSGDVHRATLNYSQDGLYTLDVEYTDFATNEAEDIEEEEFTIDNTDPEIIISGVEEQMPYSGEVRPEISFSDNNYDSHTITMTRTEREHIGVDVTEAVVGAVGVSIDGTGKGTGSRILEDVEHLEENDGIYTLTVNVVDKAGRSTEEMITYSVNRFGSVYVYSQDLVDMLNGYYQEIEGDLYITAYNANQLVNDSTKLEITCDGSLVENQNTVADVASARQATNGGWFEYRFRLDHDDFKNDGCYEIALSDKDEAGNTRTNSDSPVSFYIDATAPMIDSIIGLEESIVNANEHQIGYAISDAIALESVAVYVNDEQVDKITDFENSTAFENSFTLGAGMRQNVRIVAHDKAGNMVDTAAESFAPAYAFNPEITVSTNFLVRWYANTAAFWGSIGAAAVVSGGAITAGVIRVRKKNKIVEED